MHSLIAKANEFGIDAGQPNTDWQRVVERKDGLVHKWAIGKPDKLREAGIEWIRESVAFADRNTVRAGQQTLTAAKIILATGSKPTRPSIRGIEHAVDSTGILALKRIPKRLVIIGGGVIGMELASIFGHVGSTVTMLEAKPTILDGFDEELASAVHKAAAGWNVTIHVGAKVDSIERRDGTFTIAAHLGGSTQRLDADTVLVATGRAPRVEGLDLEKAGVQFSPKGIPVDELMETNVPGIYAIGDVNGGSQLSPLGEHEGKIAARNAVRGNHEKMDYRVVPQTVFTTPPASMVGLSEAKLRERRIDYAKSVVEFKNTSAAVIAGETDGLIKLLFERGTGELLGAHIFGARSEELIQMAAVAMHARMTREQLVKMVPVFPSFAGSILSAAEAAKLD